MGSGFGQAVQFSSANPAPAFYEIVKIFIRIVLLHFQNFHQFLSASDNGSIGSFQGSCSSPFFEGEAEHEKITKKSYVCAANNHRQKKAACSEPKSLLCKVNMNKHSSSPPLSSSRVLPGRPCRLTHTMLFNEKYRLRCSQLPSYNPHILEYEVWLRRAAKS